MTKDNLRKIMVEHFSFNHTISYPSSEKICYSLHLLGKKILAFFSPKTISFFFFFFALLITIKTNEHFFAILNGLKFLALGLILLMYEYVENQVN